MCTDDRVGKGVLAEILLDLAFARGVVDEARLRGLNEADWSRLGLYAEQHRLEPILHDRLSSAESVPERLRRDWREGYRFWAMKAAAARVDLEETMHLLGREGYAPLALKGAFLAWHAYTNPALRPLRDLDILIPADRVRDAYALLRDRGWAAPALRSSQSLSRGKHLPPLTSRCGTAIELHHRLWERDGELDHHSPLDDHAALDDHGKLLARAVTIDGIAYPCVEDMLAHLIVHAVYSHRLDCGPLLLADVGALAGAWSIDWQGLRARASRERWEAGLDLIIALLDRYLGLRSLPPELNAYVADRVSRNLMEAATELLVQDLATRRSAGLVATALVRGAGGMAARISRGASERLRPDARGDDVESLGGWTSTRLRRTVGELIDPAVRDQARDLSRLSKWLGA